MATVTLVQIFKDLSNRPKTGSRQMQYAVKRIEDEITKRARDAARKFGVKLQ